jgi:hypothetical protein
MPFAFRGATAHVELLGIRLTIRHTPNDDPNSVRLFTFRTGFLGHH